MKKLIALLLLTWGLCFVVGCTKERTTCPEVKPPEEKEYQFIYSFVGSFSTARTYTYSSKTGEVVDTMYYGRAPFSDARFSRDGKRLYCTGSDYAGVWMTDWQKGDTLSINSDLTGNWLAVSHDEEFLLVSQGAKAYILTLPQLQITYQTPVTSNWYKGTFHPFKDIAYIPRSGEDSLLIVDLRQAAITSSKIPLKAADGSSFSALSATFSSDGRFLILMGGSHVEILDAGTLEIVKDYSRPARLGPYFHPDGTRVFFLEPWSFEGSPSSIWELNLKSFVFRRILDGRDFAYSYRLLGLNPSDIDFTPDGKYAFVISGGEGMEHGPILKWDMESYRIVDAFYPPAGVSRTIRINPMEIINGG